MDAREKTASTSAFPLLAMDPHPSAVSKSRSSTPNERASYSEYYVIKKNLVDGQK